MKRVFNLFVAGGCHIIGAEVGMQNSFVAHVLTSIKKGGHEADATLFPYALLKTPDEVLEACQLSNPDLVILQIGNYESTPPSLKKLVRKRFGIGKKPVRDASCQKTREVTRITTRTGIRDDQVDPSVLFRQYVHPQTTKHRIKRIIDRLLEHPYVDFKLHEANFEQFLARLRAQYAGPVLVLGPFPSADPFITTYRRLLSDRFAARVNAFGVQFIDVCQTLAHLEQSGAGFVDRMHFNALNHLILGRMVADWAARSIPDWDDDSQVVAMPELVLNL